MKNYLILILFISCNTIVFSQKDKITVKGVVRSRILATNDDNAIPGVIIKDNNGKSVGKTNTYGEFEFKYSKSLLDINAKFTFIKKEFKSKETIISDQSLVIVHLDCEDDKYLREEIVTVIDNDKKNISEVDISHSFYHNNSKTDESGVFVLRAPNPRYLDNWENKDETQEIVITLSKKGFVSQKYKTTYHDLREPITITLQSLAKINLVYKNEKNEIEKHSFVNLESLKDFVILIEDKQPLLAKLIQNKIDEDSNLLIFDMVEDQKNILVIEIEDENNVKKKYKFVNLDAIEDYILEIRETNPELSKKIKAQLLEDPDFKGFDSAELSTKTENNQPINTYVSGLILKTVLHDFNISGHNKVTEVSINDVVKTMKENIYLKISIESHTDNKGSEEYNLTLSKKRAKLAKAYLINKGISGKRISISYFGESKPVTLNENGDGTDNVKGREKNRRTEFKVLSNIVK